MDEKEYYKRIGSGTVLPYPVKLEYPAPTGCITPKYHGVGICGKPKVPGTEFCKKHNQ